MGQIKQFVNILAEYENTTAFKQAQSQGEIGSTQFYKNLMAYVMRKMKGCIDPGTVNTLIHAEYDL